MSWLHTIVAGTSLALVFEVLETAIPALVGAGTQWATIFSGIAVLGLLFVFGLVYSETLPPRFAERVWAAEGSG